LTIESMIDFIKTIEMKDNNVRRSKIIEQLETIGCDYTVQTYPFKNSTEEGHNVIVRLGDSCQKIVIGAHYDVAQGSGGANDNGSGVSILLKFIQDFKTLDELSNSIDVVFFDHEETPESGAKYYVDNSDHASIAGMLNLDICGMGDIIVFDDKGRPESPIVESIVEAIESLEYNYSLLRELPASDERQFEAAGIPNIQLAAIPEEDIVFVKKLVAAQKELRRAIQDGEVSPCEADVKIKEMIGGAGLPKLLRVMHTPADLAAHLSEKTLMMVLDVVKTAVLIFDRKTADH
jgi:Zn-dependent M28 family amino/carboxypeptidase